ncbi:MAG: Gfo/Idh/MocA family oxidoreductase [Williamsia herbipolensis]|nr:Gfo/Idh/MocA family oxidoreductase [Williamsia herbipolensis]
MSASRVGIGIIGGGLMGREIAAAIARWPALVDHPVRPEVVSVADINPAVLPWFADLPTVTQTVTDPAELLANPDVDVVYVAVRHDLHERLYTDVVEAGKDLLAEKPFGIDRAAADAILAAVRRSGRFVRVSSEMPFFPGAQAAIQRVASGALGPLIEVHAAFLHSSDYHPDKPVNWKRQVATCGRAGVMNDLGLHAWHVPLRLGLAPAQLFGVLQDLVPSRPGPDGAPVVCDTIENARVLGLVPASATGGASWPVPLTVETKRIAPGEKNTWEFRAVGMDGAVSFSTAEPKSLRILERTSADPSWQLVQTGSQSVWPTVTGPIFEFGFSDAILQMWAAFLAERAGELGDRFGCATPEEAALTHRLYDAAWASASGSTLGEVVPLTGNDHAGG